ncbi:MAG: O-antigen ligase family protein [Pseudomonadota bacterium]
MEKYARYWSILVLGPLLLTPLIAVEFPRALAYIPLICLIPAFVILKQSRVKISFSKKSVFFLVGFLVLIWGNTIVTGMAEDAVERALKLTPIAVLGSVFLFLLSAGKRFQSDIFFKYLLISCSIAAAFISIEILLDAPFYSLLRANTLEGRFDLSVFNRGSLAIAFLTFTALFLGRESFKNRDYLLLIPIILMLFIVKSQSAQLAAFIALLTYFYPYAQPFARYFLLGGISICCIFAPFFVQKIYKFVPDTIHENAYLQTAYVGNRAEIWDFISRKAIDKPIVGHGLEFTRNFKGFETDNRFLNGNTVLHPHNAILQIWIELGLIGIVGALILLWFLFKKLSLISDKNLRQASFSMLLTISAVACFSYGLWQSWWLGLMFIVAGVFLNQASNIQKEDKQRQRA